MGNNHVTTNIGTSSTLSPFWVMVQKEAADHIRSWRFLILLLLVMFASLASMYNVISVLQENPAAVSASTQFLYLKIFTEPSNNLPPFIALIGYLGPLIGIAMGFDAVNSEEQNGTLSRIVSQAIPRDYFINSKFLGALVAIVPVIFSLGFLVIGIVLIITGLPPAPEEVIRILLFLFFMCVYISFWLNLGIMFSILFRQTATSALSALAVWLFFTVFYTIIVRFFAGAMFTRPYAIHQIETMLSRISPNFLFNELTTILLTPSIRNVGSMNFEQVSGTIPTALPVGQSLLLVSPDITALVAATLLCFAVSYVLFMRQEIRA